MNWKGKTAIVTGASGGIGSAVCEKLASLQMNQVITGRKMDVLEKLLALYYQILNLLFSLLLHYINYLFYILSLFVLQNCI